MRTFKEVIPNYKLVKDKSADIHKVGITTSYASHEYIRQFWQGDIEIYESFFLLLLNRSNHTIGYVKISQGGISGTVADMKLIGHYSVKALASAVIVAHNHPSGNLTPSKADIELTKKIKAGLQLLDIQILDHLILTEDSYLSFADEGLI